jgi:hypothetical protein
VATAELTVPAPDGDAAWPAVPVADGDDELLADGDVEWLAHPAASAAHISKTGILVLICCPLKFRRCEITAIRPAMPLGRGSRRQYPGKIVRITVRARRAAASSPAV